jgi:hypothetical protein
VPGALEVGRLLLTIRDRAAPAYDVWAAHVRVYALPPPEPSGVAGFDRWPRASRYRQLLAPVPPERQGVPLLMHALLEQVARNSEGDGSGGDSAAADAAAGTEAAAEAALAAARAAIDSVLAPLEVLEGARHGAPLLAAPLVPKERLHLVLEVRGRGCVSFWLVSRADLSWCLR